MVVEHNVQATNAVQLVVRLARLPILVFSAVPPRRCSPATEPDLVQARQLRRRHLALDHHRGHQRHHQQRIAQWERPFYVRAQSAASVPGHSVAEMGVPVLPRRIAFVAANMQRLWTAPGASNSCSATVSR